MNWLFWILLLAGIVLVIWPFFTALSAGMAIFFWILGALAIIAAFFVLPAWWGRPTTAMETGGSGTNYPGQAPPVRPEEPTTDMRGEDRFPPDEDTAR